MGGKSLMSFRKGSAVPSDILNIENSSIGSGWLTFSKDCFAVFDGDGCELYSRNYRDREMPFFEVHGDWGVLNIRGAPTTFNPEPYLMNAREVVKMAAYDGCCDSFELNESPINISQYL